LLPTIAADSSLFWHSEFPALIRKNKDTTELAKRIVNLKQQMLENSETKINLK
jgi:hypothetical protein